MPNTRKRVVALTLLFVSILWANILRRAQADTLTAVTTTPVSITSDPWISSLTFSQFDPSLGALESVEINFSSTMQYQITVTNELTTVPPVYFNIGHTQFLITPGYTTYTAATGTVGPSQPISVDQPWAVGFVSYGATSVGANYSYSLPEGAGSINSGILAGSGSRSILLNRSNIFSGLDWFIGNGAITMPANSNSHLSYVGYPSTGNVSITDVSSSSLTGSLIYTYNPHAVLINAGSIDQPLPVAGGIDNTGGGEVTIPDVTSGGTFTNEYLPVATEESLSVALGAAASGINFGLVGQNPDGSIAEGSAVQFWDLHFDGTFTGTATMTLRYDETLTGGVDPSQFQLWHFTHDIWVPVANQSVDAVAHTITFTTDSFSPFVLGVAVPEPSTLTLAALAGLALLAVRRRSCQY